MQCHKLMVSLFHPLPACDRKDGCVSCNQEVPVSGSNDLLYLNLDYLPAYGSKVPSCDGIIQQGDGVTQESEALNLSQDLDFPSPTDQSYGGKYYSVKILFLIR